MFLKKKKKRKIPSQFLESKYFNELGYQDLNRIYEKYILLFKNNAYKAFYKPELVKLAKMIGDQCSYQAEALHNLEESALYYQKMIKVSHLGLRLNKNCKGVLWNLGIAYYFLERFKQAIKPFKRMIKIEKKYRRKERKLENNQIRVRIIQSTPQSYLASIYTKLVKSKKAVIFHKEIVDRKLGDKYSWLRLADTYMKIKKFKKAKFAYLKAAELFPHNQSIRNKIDYLSKENNIKKVKSKL